MVTVGDFDVLAMFSSFWHAEREGERGEYRWELEEAVVPLLQRSNGLIHHAYLHQGRVIDPDSNPFGKGEDQIQSGWVNEHVQIPTWVP